MQFFINKEYNHERFSRDRSILHERKSSKAMKLPGYKYCDAMAALCSKVASGDYSRFKASHLRSLFKGEFPRSAQHDANEFIIELFGKLQDEQTPKSAKFNSDKYEDGITAWEDYSLLHTSIIDELFNGMIQTKIKCGKCK